MRETRMIVSPVFLSGFLQILTGFVQRKDKFRTDSFGADDIDMLIVSLDHFLDNSKPQSGSLLILSTGQIRFIETFPDFNQFFFRNTDSLIFYRDKDLIIFS